MIAAIPSSRTVTSTQTERKGSDEGYALNIREGSGSSYSEFSIQEET